MTWYFSSVLWPVWTLYDGTTGFSQSVSANSMQSPPEKNDEVQNCQSLNFPVLQDEWNQLILTQTNCNKYQFLHATRYAPSLIPSKYPRLPSSTML